jgi:hypothetical protein
MFCDVCGADAESIQHVLMGCTVAREFWRKVKTLTGAKLPTLHPATWATDMLSSKVCTDKERGIFIIGMYALWMQRNQRRHGEQGTPISIAVKWAIDTAYDLWNLHKPIPPAQPKAVHRWQPPPEGWFKCNTDGAFDARKGEGASGVALRTASGVFAGGRARWYPHVTLGIRSDRTDRFGSSVIRSVRSSET